MINWDNFSRNTRDDEEERKKEKVGTIDWDNFRQNNDKNVIEGAITDADSIKKQISDILSRNEKKASNDINTNKDIEISDAVGTVKDDEEALNHLSNSEENKINPQINKNEIKATVTEQDGNFRNKNNSLVGNTNNISLASETEKENITTVTPTDVKAMNEAEERNENIAKGGIDKFNEGVKTVLNNIQGGVMNSVAGLANVFTTAVALGAKGVETIARVFGNEDATNSINNFYDDVVKAGSQISGRAGYESNVTSRIDDDFIRTSGMVSNVISEMVTNSSIGFVLPGGNTGKLGTAIQGLSVGGRSAQEVLDENKDNVIQATITGIAKGYTSYLTEKMFDANILTKGQGGSISDMVDDFIFKNISSNFGRKFASKTVDILGENIEELVEDNVDNLIDFIVNDKDFPTIQEWLNNASETAKVTTISTIIMSLLGLGGSNVQTREQNALTRKAEQYINDNSLAIQIKDDVINSNERQEFYLTNFGQDGNVESLQAVNGKQINNPNKKVNVSPVIIRNNQNNYNVIDGNTGLLLDSAPYSTLIEAQSRFDNKMINLDEASIKGINSKIVQANIAISQKTNEVISEAQSEIIANAQTGNENVMNIAQSRSNNVNDSENVYINPNVSTDANTNTYQTPQNRFTDDLNNNTQNYISNNVNPKNMQNNSLEEVSKLVSQISDNSIYNSEKASQAFRMVARNIPNVELQINGDSVYLNSLDNNGNITYQQKLSGRPYTGARIKEIINNAINNAGLSNINVSQTNQNGFRSISNNETTKYASSNKNENVRQNNEQYNLSDKEIRNIVKYNQDGREISDENYVDFLVERYKDNKNISGVVTDTRYVESIEDKTKNDKITELYKKINDKEFKITKELKNENGNIQIIDIDLIITKKGINESFNKGFSNEKYAVVPYLDIIIKTAEDGTIRAETKMRKNIMQWYYLYNTAEINGQLYGIKIDIKKTPQGDRFYVHRVNLVHKNGTVNQIPAVGNGTIKINTVPNTSITQSNSSVKNNTNVNKKSMQNKRNSELKAINSLNDIKTKYKNQIDQLNIFENKDNTISINNLVVKQNLRNKGIGQSILNDIMDYADKTNKTITLTPTSEYLTKNKLINWYKRNGFVENKGKNTDFSISDTMYKLPKNNMQNNQRSKDDGIRAERTSNTKYNNYTQKEIDNLKSPKIRIANNENDVLSFIESAKKMPSNLKLYFGKVTKSVANRIKSNLGIDVSNYNISLKVDAIRHILKNHSNSIAENNRGQVAITEQDILNIPEIINNYDLVRNSGTTSDGRQSITFEKNINGNNIVVTYVSDKHSNLEIQTMYKFKNKKGASATASNASNALNRTSKTNSGTSTPSTSIPQTTQNVKDNGIRAERTSNTTEYDNQGNKLTKAQQEFFKDSKVRDENGKLLVMYHGTEANVGIPEEYWFTVFDIDMTGRHGSMLGNGFYFTSDKSHAEQYAHTKGHIYETYLNIINPLELNYFSTGYLAYAIRNINPYIEADIYKRDGTIDGYKVRRYLLDNGYDGIHSGNTYVAFDSNQIKNITNNSPTSNPDIRYEKTNNSNMTSQQYNSRSYEENEDFMKYLNENEYLKNLMEVDEKQGETYAHNAGRLVEQEIRKLEQTDSFDDSIPVTKLTDIDREIENYLGRTIGKGHFRERARGIYNKSIDRIRVKEYKDLDNVFHELGHALDLGGRITVDKASLSDELLAAVRRHGGYENVNESIEVLLDEGFAEILKTYAINKDIVKQDYPKSYKVLEDFKVNNVEFGKFITKLQEDTYNYIHQSPRNRGLSNQSIGEQTDREAITIEKIAQKAVKTVYDSNYEVKRMQEEFSKANGHNPTPSQNAYLLTRLASGVDNKIVSMLTNGYVDENGNKLMPGLGRIGEILGNDPKRINDLRAYLAARRDLEYKAKTLKTGLRTMDSKAIIELFYNDVQIQEAAQIVYDTLDGVLQYAVDNGLITEENAKSLRESNVFYVPFQRVIQGRGNQVGRRGAVTDIIKQRTGSELDIKDVLENIVTNSANIIKQVENNNILRAVYEQGEETGMKNNVFDEIPAPMRKIGTEHLSTWEAELKRQWIDTSNLDLEKTIDLFAPNNNIIAEKDGSHIVSFFNKNGHRKYLQFYKESTDIFNALMGLDKNTNSMFLRIMRKMNMPLRYGATMANVGFAIPNMISDTVQASIFSEAGFIPVVDNVLGVLDVLGATNKNVRNFLNQFAPEYAQRINRLYDIYQQTGATSSMRMAQYRKSAQEIMRDIYGTKNSEVLGIKESFKPLKRLMDLLTYIPELSESSTRFRVFEKNYEAYRNKGGNELDARIKAAIESRDATQDFGRTGTVMREINQIIPFSAARVGSAYTFAEKVKANPKRVATRVAILATVAMAIKALGYDDDEIEELNQRKKDDNFVLKIGDTIVTIKKPQGVLRSIINLVEYVQDLATGNIEEGKEWDRLGEWLNNAIMDNMPADEPGGLVPNAIAPIVENFVNKDFYYNNDIVKSWDLDLPDSQQYYDYTSQLAIWLGSIFNYSPAKIDNLISGYFGSLGTQLTNVIDWISGKLGFSAEEPAMGAEDNAVGKRFVVNVNENSASVDEIYDREEELTKKLNGGTITEEENEELERIKDGISKLSALNKQIKAIKQDFTTSGAEKAELIRPLQEQKTDVARQALGKEPIYAENTDDLDALEFYPTRSTLSYNGYTLNLTEEMKDEYKTTAYELYKKYEKQGLYSKDYLEKIKSKCKDVAKKQLMQKYRNQLTK